MTDDSGAPGKSVSWRRVALPLVILAACVLGARFILASSPKPVVRPQTEARAVVDAMRLEQRDYQVFVNSQGTVQPTRTTELVAQVEGSVTTLSPGFVIGGRFQRGDVLVELDQRDYRIGLRGARASLAQSRARLAEEQALSIRAREDWDSLGRGGEPSPLTLREPQLAAAEASLDAAQAEVERARLELERTRIIAPYDGRVLAQNVDAGQYVARGSSIGRIHSLASLEVRLPLGNRQLTWVTLPGDQSTGDLPPDASSVRVDDTATGSPARAGNAVGAPVTLTARVGGRQRQWQGTLVRTEGVDAATQQLTVVARVTDLNGEDGTPLRTGQYVQARIAGDVLEEVVVIPRAALGADEEVLLLDDQDRVFRRSVTVAWLDREQAVISDGLAAGEVLVLTPMATIVDGTPVDPRIDGEPVRPVEPAVDDGRQRFQGS